MKELINEAKRMQELAGIQNEDDNTPSLGDIVKVVHKNKILPGVFRFVEKVGSKAEIQKLSGDGKKILGNFIFPMDSVTKI
jgi:hypothetical protein